MRARVGEYESRMQRAREMMKTAPQIEAEFSQLNRDYGIQKKNYEDLVARRESASLSGDLEGASWRKSGFAPKRGVEHRGISVIGPVESVGLRVATKRSLADHASMFRPA